MYAFDVCAGRLDQAGYDVGARFLELCMAREKPGKRETKLVAMLQYVSTNMWKTLFGRKADGLEKSKEHEHTCGCRGVLPVAHGWFS
jgi:hypothetical protein